MQGIAIALMFRRLLKILYVRESNSNNIASLDTQQFIECHTLTRYILLHTDMSMMFRISLSQLVAGSVCHLVFQTLSRGVCVLLWIYNAKRDGMDHSFVCILFFMSI